MKKRLDLLVAERMPGSGREQAQRLIRTGRVRVDGHPRTKPGHLFQEEARIEIVEKPRFASRGGDKLEAAFERFPLSVEGLDCLDVGASTGGFTDCLLQHGAARVIALDVGKGQLSHALRTDPRVTVLDQVNARYLKRGDLPYSPAFACIDVSFISLKLVLPAVISVLDAPAELVTLIKPQFEAGREHVGRGGVVRDEAVHRRVVEDLRVFATGNLGLSCRGVEESPLRGPAGNREFLAWWMHA